MAESKAWVMAESLDAIMDIYSEDDSDQLATEIGLVEKLRGLLPHFKTKVRTFHRTISLIASNDRDVFLIVNNRLGTTAEEKFRRQRRNSVHGEYEHHEVHKV